MTFAFLCIVSLYVCLAPLALHNTFDTPVARYSLFVLKVPLNADQLTNLSRDHFWLGRLL